MNDKLNDLIPPTEDEKYGKTETASTYPDPNRYAYTPNQKAQCATAPVNPYPSMAEQAEKSYYYHREEAEKAKVALAFFRAHPEFQTFIQLIRAGAIQL